MPLPQLVEGEDAGENQQRREQAQTARFLDLANAIEHLFERARKDDEERDRQTPQENDVTFLYKSH
jgi:hypothetical protein